MDASGHHNLAGAAYFNTTKLSVHRSSTNNTTSNSSQLNSTAIFVFVPLTPFEIVQICIFITVIVISFCANGVLLFATWVKAKNSSGAWLLFYLVLVNFLETIVILPADTVFFARKNVDPFSGESSWQIAGKNIISLLFEWCTRFSWMLVGLISIDRFCAIVRTMTYQKDFPRRRVKNIFLGIFAVNSLASMAPFVARLNADFHPNRHFCTIQRRAMYGYFVMDLLFFLVPFCAMLYCWGRIFALAWSKRLKVYIGNIAQPSSEATTVTESSEKSSGSNTTTTVLAFLHRSTSKDSINSGSSSNATTSRKQSATAFVYNRTHKALITVSLILGTFALTVGVYTVSVLLEVFETPLHTVQPWWFYGVADCTIFASSAIYPFTYGFLHRSVRKDVYTAVRSLFGHGPVSAPPLQRRWSISSHIMDYLPASVASRSHSRRTSDDVLGSHKRRRSSTSEESDAISDTSFFHNFLRVKASRRRESAPSRLQNSVLDSSGIVLTFATPNTKQSNGQEDA